MFRRRVDRTLTIDEVAVVGRVLPHWIHLDDHERDRLQVITADLLDRCHWEAAHGFTLTDEIRLTIAAHAALLAIGLPGQPFGSVKTIVVHPSTITLTGARSGPVPGTITDSPTPVLGHTTAHGPIFITWDIAREQARHPERGHNVVFHEFAHKLDFSDGSGDGTPPLDGAARKRWIEVCQAEFDEIRAGRGSRLLRDYAATNPSEFFAVATEVFFDRSTELHADRPELYAVLSDYYRQDPAARFHLRD